MAHLNTLKMIGLVILLAIALALPSVLPESAATMDARTNGHTGTSVDNIAPHQNAVNTQIVPTIKL